MPGLKKNQGAVILVMDPHVNDISLQTSGSAMAEGLRDALVSRNSATTKYRYRVALFA